MSQSSEEELIQRYFAAFNGHDLEGVLACFHPDAVIVDCGGSRYDGLDAARSFYAKQLAITPDARCDLRSVIAADGTYDVQSGFEGTRARDGRVIRAIGFERLTFLDGRIKEIQMHHHPEQ